MNPVRIDAAREEDLTAILELLKLSDLPCEDVAPHLPDFIVARLDGRIIGAAGLEVRGSGALLRSLAVLESHRGTGLGKDLTVRILEHARGWGVRQMGLLTTTAEGFFAKAGFKTVSGNEAPGFVRVSREFREFCPSSAALMTLELQ